VQQSLAERVERRSAAANAGKDRPMIEQDKKRLSPAERNVLGLSLAPPIKDRRIREILLSAGTALLGVGLIAGFGIGLTAITAMSLVLILISAVEKISYSKEIFVYRSLVRELTVRIDELEARPDAEYEGPHRSDPRPAQLSHSA
jgi:hypothetical protein